MARIRTVKPSFWGSPDTAKLSRDARLLVHDTRTAVLRRAWWAGYEEGCKQAKADQPPPPAQPKPRQQRRRPVRADMTDRNAYEIEKADTPPTVEELDYQQTVAELRYLDQRGNRR